MNLYVGNLSFQASEEDLQELFTAYGKVDTATVIRDRFSGESRGFGFVEMPDRDEAMAAIAGLAGKDLQGRAITVNEARPREDNRRGGDRGGRGGGGGRRW
ncbi:MAG TPA: RNA-binding protein [Roseiflexaceae bacterium]|jgi:RNA recognition motif-containing protein|nr:RNA-binding protein [Roseiflexaceae bacterium]